MEPMFQQLAISLLLGLLVGLQREHAASGTAGMRTFPLITLFGSLSAMISERTGGWVLAAAMLCVVTVAVVGHLLRNRQIQNGENGKTATGPLVQNGSLNAPQPGVTTDVAMLLMFAVGAFLVVGETAVAVAVGASVAVLLQFKPELHKIAQKLGDEDLRAIMQFVLITCVILPVLPSGNYGPGNLFRPPATDLNVLNPREIWLMVALIVGLSLSGYIIYKYFGRNAGILLGGLLGGAISSTATTVSYSKATRDGALGERSASIIIMIASTVMYLRIVVAVAVVSPEFLGHIVAPMGILMFASMLPAIVLWRYVRREPTQMPKQQNPTQLTSAVIFGVLFAAVLLAMAYARHRWPAGGMYAVAFLSGLTEMDAITLSTARLSVADQNVLHDGWRIIVVAAMANLVSKSAIAGILGGWRLMVRIAIMFAVSAVAGAAMLLWW
jgi:uncharacterized membrane protein (DUF4010 family)